MAATIQFRDYLFDARGTPQWGRRIEFEKQGDGLPRIARSTYTIKQQFEEQSFADNEAQIALLNVALAAGEGALLIKDENGGVITSTIAKVVSHDVPQSWRQYVAEITVVLETHELIAQTRTDATFAPSAGGTVTLANVQEWKQSTETTRFNNERANRRETRVNISASGFVLADKTLTPANRRAALQNVLNGYQLCNGKSGSLSYAGLATGGFQVEQLDGDMGDGTERLNWSLRGFAKIYPSGNNYAEADFILSTRDDYHSGRRVTNVRGNIRAESESQADIKADSIKAAYATSGVTIDHAEIGDARLDGADGSTWVDMTFDFQFSQPIPNIVTYELRVDTRTEVSADDNVITYSGKVVASNSSAALTLARTLGFNKYPFLRTGEETLSYQKSSQDTAEQFVEVDFSYEYLVKATYQFAEVSRQVVAENFGDSREIIGGYVAAATESAARNFANQFLLSGRILRGKREIVGERVLGNNIQLTRFDFTYEYYLTQVSVSIAYGKETRLDNQAGEKTTTYSGIARGPSETACVSALNSILPSSGAQKQTEYSTTANYETIAGQSQFVSVSFAVRFISLNTDVDLLDAQMSIRKVFSADKAVLSTIPYGNAYVQRQLGRTIGLVVITGSATARVQATARDWGRQKISLLPGNGEEDPREEETTSVNLPNDSAQVKNYRFNFTYSARYPNLSFA